MLSNGRVALFANAHHLRAQQMRRVVFFFSLHFFAFDAKDYFRAHQSFAFYFELLFFAENSELLREI